MSDITYLSEFTLDKLTKFVKGSIRPPSARLSRQRRLAKIFGGRRRSNMK